MPLSREGVKQCLTKMSNSGQKLNQVKGQGGARFADGEAGKDYLPPVFVSGECKFTARIVADKNGALCRTYMSYNVPVPTSDGTEERVFYTVEGVEKTRNGVSYTDYRSKDPIAEYAYALAEQTGIWQYKPRLTSAYYAEIVTVSTAASQYFKPGPCVLLFNGETFKNAFESICNTLLEKRDKDGNEIGLELLQSTLDAASSGLLIDVDYLSGKSGRCIVAFDTMGGLQHEFAPEVAAKFVNILQEYAPVPGTPKNEANGVRIKEFYKRKLDSLQKYGRADDPEEPPAARFAPKTAPAASSAAKKKPAPPPASADDEMDELGAALTELDD